MNSLLENEAVATVITVALLVVALAFALLGFLQAPNSAVAPGTVSAYMLVSAGAFAVLAVFALRRQRMWQRFLGVAAAAAGVYILVMAILFYRALNLIETGF